MKNLTKSGEVIDMDDKLKGMLDVNIDDIEAKGKKRRNKNKTILAVVLLAAAVVSVCCYWGFMTKKYENALSSANNGDYGTAISDFTALGNFKDSAENAEKALKSVGSLAGKEREQLQKLISSIDEELNKER